MSVHSSELFRELLKEQDFQFETSDNENYLNTYGTVSLNGEPFEFEFQEPLNGTPGTIGAMREFSFISTENITAEEAASVLFEVIDS